MIHEAVMLAWREALDDLAADERLLPEHGAAEPHVPAVFLPFIERALKVEDLQAPLVDYHAKVLQTQRAAVVACSDEPQRTLLHTPLELEKMPRMRKALSGLFAFLESAAIDPTRVVGAGTPDALLAARPTLGALFAHCYYGGYAPPLYLGANDLAALARELTRDDVLTVIDRRLSGPLLHELTHFGRDRSALASPYLDECIAAWIGVRVYPELAVPPPGEDNAMALAGWFTQVGAHLARLFGQRALLRAHAGVTPWSEVLPNGMEAELARLAWEQWQTGRQWSFLGRTDDPQPWVRALWLGAAGDLKGLPFEALMFRPIRREPWSDADEQLVAWGRRALGVEARFGEEMVWRVEARSVATRIVDGRIERVARYPHDRLYVVAPPIG